MSIFLLKHSVDLSLLTKGFNIQTAMHKFVYALLGEVLHHGESREIKVLIEDETFTAKIYNIGFDQMRYPEHPDLLQVRYSPTTPIAKKLQSVFADDYQYLLTAREIVGKRKQIQLPDNNHDEIIFSGTGLKGVFVIECMRGVERDSVAEEIRQMNELDFETFESREDKGATIKTVERIQRVRQLDRSIGDTLKHLYDFRCQMTGKRIGDEHGVLW